MQKSVYNLINDAQHGSKNDMLILVEQFQPLIKKYSYRLRYDDAVGDVTLSFIEIIHRINLLGFVQDGKDYAIISYINRSIKNLYINLSMKNNNNLCDLEFNEGVFVPSKTEGLLTNIELAEMLSELTELQKEVILLKYYYGYSDSEIGKRLSISRQSVNRLKNRAITCIKAKNNL